MNRPQKSEKPSKAAKSEKPVLLALALGTLLMVASGMGYRVVSDYLNSESTGRPLPPGTLATLPMRIGDWQGVDVPLNEAVAEATDADDYLSRTYTNEQTGERVWFYLSYGVRARDLMPHRPEVCYPGNGWIADEAWTTTLPPTEPDAPPLHCRTLTFSKVDLEARTAVVVNYYMVDDESCPDVSLLRSKAWRGSGAMDYVAQVQVVASARRRGAVADAREAAERFASASARAVRQVLTAAGTTERE